MPVDRELSSLQRARAVKPKVRKAFERVVAVNGVGLTRRDGSYAVKVNLAAPPARGIRLPTEMDGVAVIVAVPGRIRKQG